jgi:hypothetical protein
MKTDEPDLETVVKFLCGESPMNEFWYGERPAGKTTFWWREELHEAFKTASTLNREVLEENERLKTTMKQIHNRIMVQWEKDYGSIHSEQPMDAYTVSGFIKSLLSESSQGTKPIDK